MIDQIAADRVVAIHHHRHFQFCADAIGAGDQHRLTYTFKVAGKHAAEASDIGKNSGRVCGSRQVADAFHRGIGVVDIDAGVFVSDGTICHGTGFNVASQRSNCRSDSFASGSASANSIGYFPV